MKDPRGRRPYGTRFLREQRQRLERERQRVTDDIAALAGEVRDWSQHDDAGVDQHMADDATALSEQELDVSLLGSAQAILAEIDDALVRLDDGTYGWDEEGGCWIREDRLRALPWARREIDSQIRYELRLEPQDEVRRLLPEDPRDLDPTAPRDDLP